MPWNYKQPMNKWMDRAVIVWMLMKATIISLILFYHIINSLLCFIKHLYSKHLKHYLKRQEDNSKYALLTNSTKIIQEGV